MCQVKSFAPPFKPDPKGELRFHIGREPGDSILSEKCSDFVTMSATITKPETGITLLELEYGSNNHYSKTMHPLEET